MRKFETETGKNAIWKGKITKQFKEWKKKQKEPERIIPVAQSYW